MSEKKAVKLSGNSVNEYEANRLMEIAVMCAKSGYPGIEIGSFIGSSTVFIGHGYKKSGNVLFAVDTHRGSSTHQPGEVSYAAEYYNPYTKKIDTFAEFIKQVERNEQTETVIPIVTDARILSLYWTTPLSMIFIDAEHDIHSPTSDYNNWVKHLVPGGFIVFHDVWLNKEQRSINGRFDGPYLAFMTAVNSGLFSDYSVYQTLGILKKKETDDKPL